MMNRRCLSLAASTTACLLTVPALAQAPSVLAIDVLSQDRTYYVRLDGSDANDGLTDDGSGAFRTLQHAWDNAANSVFLAGHKLTIKLAAGSFDGLETSRGILGGGEADLVVIEGSGSSTVITGTSGKPHSFYLGVAGAGNVILTLANMKLVSPTGYGILAFGGAVGVHYRGLDFGPCGGNHINAAHNAWVYQTGPCKISGSAMSHLAGSTNAIVAIHGGVIDVIGQPNFSQGFVTASGGAGVYPWPLSGTGLNNITGPKFTLYAGSTIDGGGSVNNLPGTQPGINNGGWYV